MVTWAESTLPVRGRGQTSSSPTLRNPNLKRVAIDGSGLTREVSQILSQVPDFYKFWIWTGVRC